MRLKFLAEMKSFIYSKKRSEWEEEQLEIFVGRIVLNFVKGAVVSFSVAWPVAGLAGGRWNGGRSMDAGIDQLFVELQGTPIQTDLASFILREFKDDESLLILLRKHFYSEQVFGDVNPDVPLFRWRPRNTYVDSASSRNHTQADRVEFYQQSHQYKPTTEKSEATRSDSSENNGLPEKQNNNENRNWDLFVDPLESIFGYPVGSKETKPMKQSEATEVLSRRQARALKSAHGRQRSNDARLL
ncbi:hypothetical protein FCM35_KLT08348 [Carex littledalei]|uniref:Uncharacterized protein n=1 Tax=Carex littledalei TaxID=544730 RepID=A0A833QPN7_9POAL|nr:hypothetical protein FCM35_KLT08348 [Carex littledalei]